MHRLPTRFQVLLLAAAMTSACQGSAEPRPAADAPKPTPTYSQQNGKLSELDFDRDGDGRIDTRAYMDGVLVKSIEIDRDGSGKPDRWEYYEPVTNGVAPAGSPDGHSVIARAEEANGKGKIDRREFYDNGLIARVEEDTDGDGKTDKWEQYHGGLLISVDLDLHHRGRPERRLVYRADGTLDHLEADPDGDGEFKVVTSKADEESAKPRSSTPASAARAASAKKKGGR